MKKFLFILFLTFITSIFFIEKAYTQTHQKPSEILTNLEFVGKLQTKPLATMSPTKTPASSPSPSVSASSQASSSAVTIPPQTGKSVSVPILTYHYISPNPNPKDKVRDNLLVLPEKLDAQVGYLISHGYNFISLDTLYAALKGGSLPPKPIILTFDDGYVDFYTNAYPILKKYNAHATAFIPTGLMNQGYYLSWDQIKEMDASGLVSFQAHSVNHLNLSSLPTDQLVSQLTESKKVLESRLGKPVNFMAYPYGISDYRVWEETKKAGYLGAVGTYYGYIETEGNLVDMPRIKIANEWTLEEFSKHIP